MKVVGDEIGFAVLDCLKYPFSAMGGGFVILSIHSKLLFVEAALLL
jgi:hypothetical protein